jgi:hypothetical protein
LLENDVTEIRRKTFVHRVNKLARRAKAIVSLPKPERLLVLRGLRRSGNISNAAQCDDVLKNNIVQVLPYLRDRAAVVQSLDFMIWCNVQVNRANAVSLEDHALRYDPFRWCRYRGWTSSYSAILTTCWQATTLACAWKA